MTRARVFAQKLATATCVVLLMAPAAGNIGSCGQEAEVLDVTKFLVRKAAVDCARCTECALFTPACERACKEPVDADASFPESCLPLVHDGEVCLDALDVASCDDFSAFVAETQPTIPTECDFCPFDQNGQPARGGK